MRYLREGMRNIVGVDRLYIREIDRYIWEARHLGEVDGVHRGGGRGIKGRWTSYTGRWARKVCREDQQGI